MKKIEILKPEYSKVLKRIQDSIPTEWLAKLVRREPVAPTMITAFKMVLQDPKASEDSKKKAQILLDSGYLDKEVDVVDKKWEEHINKFIDSEIEAAMKRGELPKKKKYRNAGKKIKRIIKVKHGKRNNTKADRVSE